METLNIIFKMSVTGSILFLIFLLSKSITNKHFSSSWHYKMLILILVFFTIPINNFISLPAISIRNMAKLENTHESDVSENLNINTKEHKENLENKKNNETNINIEKEYLNDIEGLKDNDIDSAGEEIGYFKDTKLNENLFKNMVQYIYVIGIFILLITKSIQYRRFKLFVLKNSDIFLK